MSKSLVKLIDISLTPAALMVVGKVLGLILTVNLFGLPWTVTQVQGTLSTIRPVVLADDLITANTYSDLAMFVLLAVGFTFVLLQATHFHDTHISPRMLMRLSNHNLMDLVKSSFDIYHAATIWLIFLWVCFFVIAINAALGKTMLWLALAAFVANTIFTTLLLQDVYQEIDLTRKTLGTQEAF
ncbi:hypothetical protein KC640_02940 [Candidatus Dojkabacteria bacterium]|uniref:Uncharacterized protein n=1 Tax=Candidatus Dojkabacteria bacterium TaxID=2099670 RepID=A0A955I5I1_9BACT|nr:hypothetical protein [Candidatus Dojkabacteria bacterium]